LLTRPIAIPPAERILENSPYTAIQASGTATYGQLCQAVATVSDNTAANLLLDLLGGPPAVTAFARALGDDVTRLDRRELDLNHGNAEDLLDTTTPEAVATTYEKLLLGDVLNNENRQKLVGWFKSNVVSAARIRAGLPASWTVADKTGTGMQGERNDVGVVFPDGNRKPVVMGILTLTHDPGAAKDQLLADVAAAIKTGLNL
jgi:beta-lactamase class A